MLAGKVNMGECGLWYKAGSVEMHYIRISPLTKAIQQLLKTKLKIKRSSNRRLCSKCQEEHLKGGDTVFVMFMSKHENIMFVYKMMSGHPISTELLKIGY